MFDAHALHYLTFLLMMPLWQCASQWPAKKKAENQQNVIKAAAKSRNNKNKNKACCWNLRFYANANEGRKANAYTYIPTNICIHMNIYLTHFFPQLRAFPVIWRWLWSVAYDFCATSFFSTTFFTTTHFKKNKFFFFPFQFIHFAFLCMGFPCHCIACTRNTGLPSVSYHFPTIFLHFPALSAFWSGNGAYE